MRRMLAAMVLAGPALAQDGQAFGTWQTEPGADVPPLQVYVAPCGYDTALTCGEIVQAEGREELLGRAIFTGMRADGTGNWRGGQLWVPEEDRTYRASMRLERGALTVRGCVALFCRTRVWTRVE